MPLSRALAPVLAVCAALAACAPGDPAQIAPSRPEAALSLQAVENRRFDAMVRRDLDELRTLLSDDLQYVHSSGRAQGKAELLSDLRSGALVYREIDADGDGAWISDSLGVTRGTARLVVVQRGSTPGVNVNNDIRVHYTAVYVPRGPAGWQLVRWQSTRVASP